MSDPKEPAFPRSYVADGHNGMTLRDWFAGQALSAVRDDMSRTAPSRTSPEQIAMVMAKASYIIADAMLEARK